MSRRPRTQAVPQAAGSRAAGSRASGRSRSAPPGPRFPWLRRGTTLVTGVGLVLIAIGLATVVSDLPTEADPTPAVGPLPITFGRTLDPNTYLVTDPMNRFEPGDPFAYSVNPPVHPGVPNVYVAISTFRAGSEVVLQEPSPLRLLPEPVSFGYATTASDLIELFGYGRFTMKMYLDPAAAVYAQGRFEVVEPALPR